MAKRETFGRHDLHHLHLKKEEAKAIKKHRHGPLTAAHNLDDTHTGSHIAKATSLATDESFTLGQLKVGNACILKHIGGEGALRRRLLDMGLTPGTRVLLRATAPMGDPLELQLRGYSLSLRRDDAALITVTPENGGKAQ